jgi:hypothetical protein
MMPAAHPGVGSGGDGSGMPDGIAARRDTGGCPVAPACTLTHLEGPMTEFHARRHFATDDPVGDRG